MSAPAATTAGVTGRWTREAVIEKIKEWNELYGEPPKSADWNPSSAKWHGQVWRIDRYRAGDWPSLNAAKRPFGGSLNAAVLAAGLTPSKPGPKRASAAPVLSDRAQMAPDVRDAVDAMRVEVRALEDRVAVRDRQLDRAQTIIERLRGDVDEANRSTQAARRAAAEARPAPVRTRTRVETHRVVDKAATSRLTKKLERLQARLDGANAQARELRTAAAAEIADLRKALARAEGASSSDRESLSEARGDLEEAVRARDAAEDRVVALEALQAREKVVIREVEVRSASDQEVEDARQAVARAQRAEEEAELRAAKADRRMRELSSLVTGEDRRLTPEELAELRKGRGAVGPGVLASAFKEAAFARKGSSTELYAALTKLAGESIRWRDALRR